MTSGRLNTLPDTSEIAPGKKVQLEFHEALKRRSLEAIVVSYEPKTQMLMLTKPQSHSNTVLDCSLISLKTVKSLTVLPNEPYPMHQKKVPLSVLKNRFEKTLDENRCQTNKKAGERAREIFKALAPHFPQRKWEGVNIVLDDRGVYLEKPYRFENLRFPNNVNNLSERSKNILKNILDK